MHARRRNIVSKEKSETLLIRCSMSDVVYLLLALLLLSSNIGIVNALTVHREPNGIIIPENGSLYETVTSQEYLNKYEYHFDLGALDGIKKKGPILVKLMIKDKIDGKWVEVCAGDIYYPNSQRWFNTTANLTELIKNRFDNNSVLGKLEYKLISPTIERPIFSNYGPEIIANFRNETFERLENGKYNYSVYVNSLIPNLKVYLKIKRFESDAWETKKLYRNYDFEIGKWKKLTWQDQPFFYKVIFIPEYPPKKTDTKHKAYIPRFASNNPELACN